MPTPELSKIKLNGVEYNIKDTEARFMSLKLIYVDTDWSYPVDNQRYALYKDMNFINPYTYKDFFEMPIGTPCIISFQDGDGNFIPDFFINKTYEWHLKLESIVTGDIYQVNGSFFNYSTGLNYNAQMIFKKGNNTVEETDPVFSASPAANITSSDITNWNNKLSSYTESDPTVSAWAKAANKPTYTASEVGATTTSDVNGLISTALNGLATVATTGDYDDLIDAPEPEDDEDVEDMLDGFDLDYTTNTLSVNQWQGGSY